MSDPVGCTLVIAAPQILTFFTGRLPACFFMSPECAEMLSSQGPQQNCTVNYFRIAAHLLQCPRLFFILSLTMLRETKQIKRKTLPTLMMLHNNVPKSLVEGIN